MACGDCFWLMHVDSGGFGLCLSRRPAVVRHAGDAHCSGLVTRDEVDAFVEGLGGAVAGADAQRFAAEYITNTRD